MPAPQSTGAVILVIEDNEVNQMLVQQQLEHLGHQVNIVGTAQEGLDLLRTGGRFDLVLMDWQLPDIDGLEATRRLRRFEAHSEDHVPVIAMTASAMPEDRAACLEAGMDDFMAKPVGLRELEEMVNRWSRRTEATEDPSETATGHQEVLAALQDDLGDAELVRSLVQRFLDDLASRRSGFRTAALEGDMTTLHRLAHTLKSTADLVGADELSDVCRAAERVEAPEALGDVLARFDRAAEETAASLRSWLSGREESA